MTMIGMAEKREGFSGCAGNETVRWVRTLPAWIGGVNEAILKRDNHLSCEDRPDPQGNLMVQVTWRS